MERQDNETTERIWTETDGAWSSDDRITIDGSNGHWFYTRCSSSGLECDTPQGAMDQADAQYPRQ